MADSLSGIGSLEIFPFEPDWSTPPASEIIMTRRLQSFPGTVHAIESIAADVPIAVRMGFSVLDRGELHDLTDFMVSRTGRLKRFWVRHPKSAFSLLQSASSGGTTLTAIPNKAARQYQGYERIYVLMNNGDLVVRHATDVAHDVVNEQTVITLDSPLDRDIGLNDYRVIGRLLLVRFDQDKFDFKMLTNAVGEITLKFHELVKEYAQI